MALPEDELKKKKNSFGDAAAVASDPSASLVQQARPGQNSPTNTWPGNQPSTNIYGVKQASPAPNPVATDPQATADRAAVGGLWEGVKGFNAKAGAAIADVASMPLRGVVGAYDSAVVRPMRAAGVNAAYLSPAVTPTGADPASMTPFYDLQRQKEQAAPTPNATAQPLSAMVVRPGDAQAGPPWLGNAANAGAGRGSVNRPLANPDAAPPVVAPTQIMPGVYQHGRGQYSDNAAGMGYASGFTGKPNAQNMAAAEALSQRSAAESLARVTAQPQGFGMQAVTAAAPGQARGFSGAIDTGMNGNMRTRSPEQQRRDAEVQSTSILKPTAARGLSALAALDGQELQNRRNAGQVDVANASNQGALDRTGIQENGANFRAGLAAQGAQVANQLRRDEFNRDAFAVGFKNDAMAQLQKAQQALQNAKTPEERKAATDTLLAMQGRDRPNRFTVVPGGQQMDESGRPINLPSTVLDNQTGQFVSAPGGGGAAAAAPKREVGTTSTVGGKTAVWDGSKWVPR